MSPVHSPAPYLSSRKIKIYNTLTGEKSDFTPIDTASNPPVVRMYVCGLTPYDHPHIGHASAGVRFDMVRRYLEYRNLKVLFQTNLTDIEDKIIDRAERTGENPLEFTTKFSDEYDRGVARLNVLPPTYFSKVTEFVPRIIEFISGLISKDFAYPTPSGNVYFDIARKDDYGKLSGQRVNELLSGTRDREPDPEKRSPLDFALWKRDDSVLSGDSPWGRGRPGWHIECSAMIHYTLGSHIDIHGGGLDLKFPHHENEIAQSEGHSGAFVNVWMHAGLLTVEGTKMSKSLGNFFTIEQALDRFGGELIRFVALRNQLRSEISFSDQLFRENLNALNDFYKVLARAEAKNSFDPALIGSTPDSKRCVEQFEEAMDNDFQTPGALVALGEALALLRKKLDKGESDPALSATIRGLSSVLGLFVQPIDSVIESSVRFACLSRSAPVLIRAELIAKLKQRQEARAAKDFAASDRIRDELAAVGIEAMDSKSGELDWRYTAV